MTEIKYSASDLEEFKALIEKKLELAREDLSQLRASMSHKNDNSTEDTAPTFKMMEDGSETMSREETAALAARQEKFIINLLRTLFFELRTRLMVSVE